MFELLVPALLIGGALWWASSSKDSGGAAAGNWTPGINPKPLGVALDNYLQHDGQGGYKPISVRFILTSGGVSILAYGTVVDAKVSKDASAGPTGKRLWRVSFDSFDPASLAAVDVKKVPGGKVPNPPAKGTLFTLVDENFA